MMMMMIIIIIIIIPNPGIPRALRLLCASRGLRQQFSCNGKWPEIGGDLHSCFENLEDSNFANPLAMLGFPSKCIPGRNSKIGWGFA